MADPLAGLAKGAGDGEHSPSPAQLDAAKDVLTAIKASDPRALCLALMRHQEADEEPADDDDEDEGPSSDAYQGV